MILLDIFFGPIHVIGASIIYFTLTISSIFIAFNREEGISRLLWILLMIFIPFLISVIYLIGSIINWFTKRKKKTLLID
jgi:hypothetical protein